MGDPRFYSIKKPTAFWGTMYAAMGGMGSTFVTLGEMIELWEKEPAFTARCKCGGVGVVTTFFGTPLSGSLWRRGRCTKCGVEIENGWGGGDCIRGWRDMVAIRDKYHPKEPVAETPATYTELAAALEGRTLETPPPPASGILDPGQSYIQFGRNPKNRFTFGTVEDASPMNAQDYFKRGNEFYEKDDYDNAIADFSAAIRLDPEVAVLHNSRGMAYHFKNEYDKAIADYTAAIRLDPKFANCYYNRGCAYSVKEEYGTAITDFTKAIALHPNDAYFYFERGIAYAEQDEWENAIPDYTEAIRLNPNTDWRYNRNRGCAYENTEKSDKALADYTESIRIKPNVGSLIRRAVLYRESGEYDKALADYAEAMRLEPKCATNAVVLSGRGWTYYLAGDYPNALADLDESLRLEPGNASRQERRDTIAAKLNA
jgi:tetratricopeptide (TPR) repeat protein